MSPGTDDQPRFVRDPWIGLLANTGIVGELSRQKWIIPASHQKHGSLQPTRAVASINRGPILVAIAMQHPQRLRRLFAYGANSDPSGARPDMESNATWTSYVERTRGEYRQLSPTPQDYERFLAQIQAMWAQQPNFAATQLQRINVRTAIADGAHDEAIKPEHTEYLARTIPGATLIVLPDVSHFGMLQNPQEFSTAAISFLR